jgi:hypothetical protein
MKDYGEDPFLALILYAVIMEDLVMKYLGMFIKSITV